MSVTIHQIAPGSPAEKKHILAGEKLLAINGHAVTDFLDYDFYLEEGRIALEIEDAAGKKRTVRLRHTAEKPLGLEFESFLMDEQRRCRNNCVFCFIDQMPKGMRETLYFKDDDDRLSFLFGNYITLTNLSPREVERILTMHISPMNVSVHTTNPELRCKMMRNRFAGESLSILRTFAAHHIALNCQLVLCPGWNDGDELSRSLDDLAALGDDLQSVSAVPVGLSDHREGLEPLHSYDKAGAQDVIRRIEAAAQRSYQRDGLYRFHASDEFYLLAGLPLPKSSRYDDFSQLENGVGMCVTLQEEFDDALAAEKRLPFSGPRKVTIATGMLAAPLLETLAKKATDAFPGLSVSVCPVENHTFGKAITVAGLLTGADLIQALSGRVDLGEEILVTENMLESTNTKFLDDLTSEAVAEAIGVPLRPIHDGGAPLLAALLNRAPEGDC